MSLGMIAEGFAGVFPFSAQRLGVAVSRGP